MNVLDYPPEVQAEMMRILAEKDQQNRQDELRELARNGIR